MYSYELRSKHPKWSALLAAEYVAVQGYASNQEAAWKLLNDLRDEIHADIEAQQKSGNNKN